MEQKVQKDTFSKFGTDFQTRVLQLLITDDSFFFDYYDIISADYFDQKAQKIIFQAIKNYHKGYKQIPTIDVLKVGASQMPYKVLSQEVSSILDSIEKMPIRDLDWVSDTTEEFCQNQKMANAILKCADLIDDGNYDEMRNVMEDAFRMTLGASAAHDLYEELHDIMNHQRRRIVPTGLGALDDLLNGGVGAGELALFMGGPGTGKSMTLVNMGYSGVVEKKTVIHFTLEESFRRIGALYCSRITGVPINSISHQQQDVMDMMKGFKENNGLNLKIVDYSDDAIHIEKVKSELDRLRFNNIHPDLLIFDYADLILPTKERGDEILNLKDVYRSLRYLSKEQDAPIWSASQSNRTSLQDDLLTGEGVAGSYDKKRIADVLIPITRKMEDKFQKRAKLLLDKSRLGPDGKVMSVHFDPERCLVRMDDAESIDATPTEMAKVFGDRQDKDEVFDEETKKKFGPDYAVWRKDREEAITDEGNSK